MRVLGIETSCDETAVALVAHDGSLARLEGGVVSSQTAQHRPFGGVVPEVATREHLRNLPVLVPQLLKEMGREWKDVDAVAVTSGPGLAPALLIGYSYARALALRLGKPCHGVNHLEGHLFSPFAAAGKKVEFPFIGLIVSGGHTLLLEVKGWDSIRKLGGTVDDAAGEVFDKVARLLGLGYPGGPEIEKRAESGNRASQEWPQSFPAKDNFNFSFSGLKTSVRYHLEKNPGILTEPKRVDDVCASFQEAVVQVLARKACAASRKSRIPRLAVSGGVACNGRLRAVLEKQAAAAGIILAIAPAAWCTDNAAMIATVAAERQASGLPVRMPDDIDPNWKVSSS